ncbi:MAG: hypothetical protein HQ507_03920 [Candidatus Marinimicrobia bacterium]|nr:hypothetical protein [Candidatus Neomarinimicrobiota bacterium]
MISINTANIGTLQPLTRTLLTDVLVLLSFSLTLVVAHVLPFPLYKLDPMKILVLVTVIYSSRWNSLAIAAALPILSFLSTGHPVFPKFLIMSSELMVFAFVLGSFHTRQSKKIIGFLSAVLISKIFYYMVKGGAIALGYLDQSLISTDFHTQIQALVVLALVFGGIEFLHLQRRKQ